MRRILINTGIVLVVVLVPLLLGVVLVGPSAPLGRNSRSSTRVGHKGLFLLLERVGFQVRRFERGVETLPDRPGTLIALEPGPALFRERGRFAEGLLTWVKKGNAALITLGPDPDRAAELDDHGGWVGNELQGVVTRAQNLRDDTRAERKAPTKPTPIGMSPLSSSTNDLDPNDSWDEIHMTSFLGLEGLLIDRLPSSSTVAVLITQSDLNVGHGAELWLTRPRVWAGFERLARPPDVILSIGGRPVLLEMRIGEGCLLLMSEPRLFQNAALGRGSHGRIAVRAIERLTERVGATSVWFEEFSHGGREAKTVIDLALKTRARWVVLQLLLAVMAWILFRAFRNRSPIPFKPPPRRSRDEAIDAAASLLLRSGDIEGAARRLVELTRFSMVPADFDGDSSALKRTGVSTASDLVEHARALQKLRIEADRNVLAKAPKTG